MVLGLFLFGCLLNFFFEIEALLIVARDTPLA